MALKLVCHVYLAKDAQFLTMFYPEKYFFKVKKIPNFQMPFFQFDFLVVAQMAQMMNTSVIQFVDSIKLPYHWVTLNR